MQRQRPQQETLPRAPTLDFGGTGAEHGQVHVLAGADAQDMALVGRTVGDARILAQAILGIDPDATAVLDGDEVRDDSVLGEDQTLEFVKYSGSKGAAPTVAPVLELTHNRVYWRRGDEVLAETSVRDFTTRIAGASSDRAQWMLHPRYTRLMASRCNGRVVGVVIEMPPGPRQVRWLAPDSLIPAGPNASYTNRRLSFPWVVLVVVFRDGEVTGAQQVFYRTAPLDSLDDALCLTNLLNVARARAQASWICLQNIPRRLRGMTWERRIRTVIDHFWQAAFNLSADARDGTGYHATGGKIDARLATVDAWETATRANPYFTLEVAWKRAPQTLGACLESQFEVVVPYRPLESTEQLATLLLRSER